jgi:hypothetical protein
MRSVTLASASLKAAHTSTRDSPYLIISELAKSIHSELQGYKAILKAKIDRSNDGKSQLNGKHDMMEGSLEE